jgi:hypothetical protein
VVALQLHEDLNIVVKKPYTERPEGNGTNDREIADLAWERHGQRENSIIRDIVGSQMRSQVTCLQCGKVSVCFEYQQTIQMAIPRNNNRVVRILYIPQYDILSKFITRRLPPNSSRTCDSGVDNLDADMEWQEHYLRRRDALRPVLMAVSLDRLSPIQALKNAVSLKVRTMSASEPVQCNDNEGDEEAPYNPGKLPQTNKRGRARSRSGSLSVDAKYTLGSICMLELGGKSGVTPLRILRDDESLARVSPTATIVAYSGVEKLQSGIFLLQVTHPAKTLYHDCLSTIIIRIHAEKNLEIFIPSEATKRCL